MPLNLSNRDQNSGHLFYNRRLKAAITRFSVRMKHDDRKQQAAVALSMVFVLIGIGWMALLHVMKPAGLVGQSAIIGNRDTGAVYAKINGRLYPALNLTSARLAVGNAAAPTWVKAAEIAKYPTGPIDRHSRCAGQPYRHLELGIGVVGVRHRAHPGQRNDATGDSRSPASSRRAAGRPRWSRRRPSWSTHKGATYVVWGGQRSQIDPTDRSVTFNLGLDPGVTYPIEISNALFDAMPATEPLVIPLIPELGTPSTWLPGSPVGSVLETRDANGVVTGFYALLTNGVQKITSFVADLLRTATAQASATPTLISPDKLIHIPAVDVLNVGFYPSGKLNFVDTSVESGDLRRVAEADHRPAGDDHHRQRTRSAGADQHGSTPGSAGARRPRTRIRSRPTRRWCCRARRTSSRRPAVSPARAAAKACIGFRRKGFDSACNGTAKTLEPLGLDPGSAVQAPWPIVRTFAAGPAISHDSALLARDTLTGGGAVAPVPEANPQAGG